MGEDKEFLVLYTKEYLKNHPNINFFIYGHRHIELDLMLVLPHVYLFWATGSIISLMRCLMVRTCFLRITSREKHSFNFPESVAGDESDKPFVSKTIKTTVADNDMIRQGNVHCLRRFLYSCRQAFVFLAWFCIARRMIVNQSYLCGTSYQGFPQDGAYIGVCSVNPLY